jgi:ABC transporter substrate binding protein
MLPVAWRRCIHLIAELGLTSNHSAASRRDAPDSTAFTTRSRNSKEHGFGIDPPSTTRINATRFNHARLSGNPDSTQPKFALGWAEGRNLQIDYRWGAGDPERMQVFAKELVELQPNVILARSTPVTAALLRQTRTIPIVFTVVSDPVGERSSKAWRGRGAT